MTYDDGKEEKLASPALGQIQQQKQKNNVTRALYPVPKPLTRLLNEAVRNGTEADTETAEEALGQLIGNSFEGMDAMYFATPAARRKHPSFSHRLCVRIATDAQQQTLSITDMGAGMTRADLINSLGIGRLSKRALAVAKRIEQTEALKESENKIALDNGGEEKKETEADARDTDAVMEESEQMDVNNSEDGDEEENHDFEEDEEGEDQSDDGEDDFDEEGEDAEGEEEEEEEEEEEDSNLIPCRVTDIGGFYSSLVALGEKIMVGTKSLHDDYYEFLLEPDYDEFSVTRPMNEGVRPTIETGFDKFEDVRGDSGTRITIALKEELKEWLDEANLKLILTKIFESSQYTVMFSSDDDAAELIEASRREEEYNNSAEAPVSSMTLEDDEPVVDENDEDNTIGVLSRDTVVERAKYIPLRLTLGERKMLRLVEATMICCDYTTEVDKPFKSEVRRIHSQLRGITSVLRGLVTACDYKAGQKLLDSDNYTTFQVFFRKMFEIARRHKIMNPEKMRTEYGKLVYLLQDAVSPTVQQQLSLSVVAPIETVYKFLEERDGLGLLSDKLIEVATEEILAGRKTRAKINNEIKRKERAVATLKQKYRNPNLSSDDIHMCLYSICDNNSFLNSNRVPIDKVITFLKKYFNPDEIEDGYSLSIVSGTDGARLSHSHERQYYFALQSLTLWRDIVDDMFRLWAMAESDLLSESVTYSLQDTGQGMQRVQQCPRTYKAMQRILSRVQGKVNKWVGSSVIHMGDHNVPNALSFIDKYTQVPRILGPIVTCLENLEKLCEKDDGINDLIESGYGGIEKLRKDILHDFFKSAFDGSGADNFYDAGSCIDGRLTSAWQWCSQLPSKPYYPIFKLTGFLGFDGEFKN